MNYIRYKAHLIHFLILKARYLELKLKLLKMAQY